MNAATATAPDEWAGMTRPALARPTPRGGFVRNPATGEPIPPDGEVVDAAFTGVWPTYERIGLCSLELLRPDPETPRPPSEPEPLRVPAHILRGRRGR